MASSPALALPLPVPDVAQRPAGTRRREWANAALRALWAKGLSSRPSLDADALVAAAARSAGSEDFGDAAVWRPNLAALSAALIEEADLNPLGRTIAHGQIVAALVNRARLAALWRHHPEIAAQPLPAPVIVLGQMRSGTTRMQRLLACDPRLAHTRFFEGFNPLPAGMIDDRRLRAALGLTVARLLNPGFAAIHPTSTAAPDEEIGFHSISLFGAAFEAQWRVPSFAAHCEALDARPVYAEFRRLLQTVAWLRGGATPRPWILKVPQFMQDVPALLHAFPDARLVCLHRDPAVLVGSSASLALNQMALQSDAPDAHWIGREWLRKVRLRRDRAAAARAAAPQVPQVDVTFEEMGRDWRPAMRRVYAMLGLDLGPALERRMAACATHHGPRHAYALGQFGLSEAEVAQALG